MGTKKGFLQYKFMIYKMEMKKKKYLESLGLKNKIAEKENTPLLIKNLWCHNQRGSPLWGCPWGQQKVASGLSNNCHAEVGSCAKGTVLFLSLWSLLTLAKPSAAITTGSDPSRSNDH